MRSRDVTLRSHVKYSLIKASFCAVTCGASPSAAVVLLLPGVTLQIEHMSFSILA